MFYRLLFGHIRKAKWNEDHISYLDTYEKNMRIEKNKENDTQSMRYTENRQID